VTLDLQPEAGDDGLFPPPEPTMLGTADLSADALYRWELTRIWDRSCGRVAFVMLNPSTAGAIDDDATIRRCLGFARAWGFGGLVVRNLYALRSTEPANLWSHPDPIGVDNDRYLARCALDELVVCAWGVHGARDGRGEAVAANLRALRSDLRKRGTVELHYLELTKEGQPRHPLYIKADRRPTRWDVTQ
jgi:hypothetical protein